MNEERFAVTKRSIREC